MPKKLDSFHSPGHALRELLEEKEWTQEDLSIILGVSLKHVNEIIKDKKPLSIELAKLLENVFKHKAVAWMELAAKYQIGSSIRNSKEDDVQLKAQVYQYMPINELFKKGWLDREKDLFDELRKFWHLEKDEDLNLSFLEKQVPYLEYRKSEAFHEFNKFNTLIWHRKALSFSERMKVATFNKAALAALLAALPGYTNTSNGIKKFTSDLADVGVKFVFLSHLSKTYLDGAAFNSDSGPVVALTGRYDRVDNFWFTLAHELSHVLLHLNSNANFIFVDDTTKRFKQISEREAEANEKAEEVLLQDEIISFFSPRINYITEEAVQEFAIEKKIHASIVVGILAFNEMVSYSTLHRFKETVKDQIPDKYRAD
jgi:HTH-type transcriptional regulator/antitoxin HigA